MVEDIHVKTLDNGLVLLGEPMGHVASVSMTVRVPLGPYRDPDGMAGAAAVGTEWWLRGAGERTTRQLNDALDSLGCHHAEAASGPFLTFSASQLGRCLGDVMALYGDILRRPRLAEEDFEPCRTLIRQDLKALDDQPAQQSSIFVRDRFFPPPLGRYSLGNDESLAAMTSDRLREHLLGGLTPNGAILAVAGNFEWPELCDMVETHLGDWSGPPAPEVAVGEAEGGFVHVPKDSAQTHIALAQPSVTVSDPHYYTARVAVAVLSGGMSARLMNEVREKRGLVYHVSTSYVGMKTHAGWLTYAGTVPAKARETLAVTVDQIRGLADGISADELARAKTQLKIAVIMATDSSVSRAGSLAGDWYDLGRIRTIEEIGQAVDAVTPEAVTDYVAAYPARTFVGVVIGPDALDRPAELA